MSSELLIILKDKKTPPTAHSRFQRFTNNIAFYITMVKVRIGLKVPVLEINKHYRFFLRPQEVHYVLGSNPNIKSKIATNVRATTTKAHVTRAGLLTF